MFHADAEIIIPVDTIPIDSVDYVYTEPTPIVKDNFFEDFEKGSKSAFAEATVTCTAATWVMTDALIGSLNKDKKNDSKSVRLKNGGCIKMTEDYTEGCDSLWFFAGMYGEYEGGKLTISYSADQGDTWNSVVSNLPLINDMRLYGFHLDVDGNVRLRFECFCDNDVRVNIDDVAMTNYKPQSTILIGDVNGDKQVSIADVTMLVNIILGKTTEGFDTKVADVNGDKQISIADVTALVNIILGK